MSYPWWHIQATFKDGTVKDYQATDVSPLWALKTLLTHQEDPGALPDHVFRDDMQHKDLVKLEVLHPSTPGLDEATAQCRECNPDGYESPLDGYRYPREMPAEDIALYELTQAPVDGPASPRRA